MGQISVLSVYVLKTRPKSIRTHPASLVLRYLRGWRLGQLFSSLDFSMEPPFLRNLIYRTSEAHRDSSSCFLREFSPTCVVGGNRVLLHKGLFFLLISKLHSFICSVYHKSVHPPIFPCMWFINIYVHIHKTKYIYFLPKYVMSLSSKILI